MKKPLKWRLGSDLDEGFDEVVVTSGEKDGCLLHAEMLDRRAIFVTIGDLRVWAHVDRKGVARVTSIENDTDVEAHRGPNPPRKRRKAARR